MYVDSFDAYASPDYEGLDEERPESMNDMFELGRSLWGALSGKAFSSEDYDLFRSILDMADYKASRGFESEDRDYLLVSPCHIGSFLMWTTSWEISANDTSSALIVFRRRVSPVWSIQQPVRGATRTSNRGAFVLSLLTWNSDLPLGTMAKPLLLCSF